MSDLHEIYAIKYGHHDRRSHENFLGGDPHDTLQPLAYFVWVIRGSHGTFVVDTGFTREVGEFAKTEIVAKREIAAPAAGAQGAACPVDLSKPREVAQAADAVQQAVMKRAERDHILRVRFPTHPASPNMGVLTGHG